MIVLLMGVSGAGKTTLGEKLAQELGWPFLDADDYHPPENVAKMAAGIPLQDADRRPWLDRLNAELRALDNAVIACSALKESYRRRLAQGVKDLRIVYLKGDEQLIGERMKTRPHRYMPASLLKSQFDTLEPPQSALAVEVSGSVEQTLSKIRALLELP